MKKSDLRAASLPSDDCAAVELSSAFIEFGLIALEETDQMRQAPGQICKQLAQRQNGDDRVHVVHRPHRADLQGKPPARFVVGADAGDGILHVRNGMTMELANQFVGFCAIVGEQSAIDIVAQRFGLGGHEIAAEPGPDRLERYAAEAADALVIGGGVDQERLERRKEQTRRVADARHPLAVGADGVPQFLEHELIARGVFPAQQVALELLDQQ